jgi:hypothetical protein
MGTAEIVPGWYADPSVPGNIRYWDGAGWTEHSAAPLHTFAPSALNAGPPPGYSLGVAPPPPVTPRRPRRRLPLPAFFILGTALIGFPLAIGIGVLAAHAAAPPPLETPVPAGSSTSGATPGPSETPVPAESPALAEDPADTAAKKDAAALGLGIKRFYQQTMQGGVAAPEVSVANGKYILGPVLTTSGPWQWPPIPMSEGVSLGGQAGTGQDDWCVWVRADGGTVKDWQVTNEGVTPGTCGLG